MKPFAIALTALAISAAAAGGASARPFAGAVLHASTQPTHAAQCAATPASADKWSRKDVAELLSYMQVPYDSISSAPGACMTVAIRGHDGMLDEEILDPAALSQIL